MMPLIDSQFAGLKSKFSSGEIDSRQEAFDFFKSHGLPNRKQEDWKYTSLQTLEKQAFELPTADLSGQEKAKIESVLSNEFYHLVFFNGEFQSSLSSTVPGVKVETRKINSENFEDGLMALNWAMTTKPVSIKIEKRATITKPVQLVFYTSAESPLISFPNVEIELGEGSVLTLIEDHVGSGTYASNIFVRIKALDSSRLSYIHCQEQDRTALHIARTHFEIYKDAHVEALSFSVGAKLSRHTQKFSLLETSAFVRSLGLYVTQGDQHSDHTGLIDHVVGGCTSYQIYKGLLKDQSRAVFNGRVLIRKNSQKAFSEQSNKNLLLSNGAEIDSKPQLEIFADDVQARHGSTVGQINPEELFYLNSRGIPTAQALPLLSFGFLSEIIYQLSDDQIIGWLKQKLQAALADLYQGEV
jgi:Fe-S cluster assembly protein SufD